MQRAGAQTASVKQVVSERVKERLENSGKVESSSQGLLALLRGYTSKYVEIFKSKG